MRRLAAIALVAGIAAGGIAALAVPREDVAPRAPEAPRIAPERALDPHMPGLVAVPGSVHVELARRDPYGGPDWVVRSFAARAYYPDRPRGRRVPSRNPLGQRWCVQLLRRYRARLGWIDGDNVFRPAGRAYDQTPLACGSRLAPIRNEPFAAVATVLTGISEPDPRPLATVVFGAGGAPARGAQLRLGGETRKPALSRRGAFLEFVPTGSEPRSVRFLYPGQSEAARKVADSSPFDKGQRWSAGGGGERLVVQTRAPDPNGGPPWAVAALRRAGRWCLTEPARVVAGRIGTINFPLGTFGSVQLHAYQCRQPGDAFLQKRPIAATYQLGNGPEPAAARTSSGRGPIERRTLPGTTLGWGTARSDVREITVTTPRDVRTIVPSGPARAWLVVYDGGFPTGELRLTAHFADGSSRVVDRFDVGGL